MLFMVGTCLTGVLLVSLIGLMVYMHTNKGKCTSRTDLSGKTVLVTGANTGIGYYTALDLARRNARVILACRNKTKGQIAVDDIQQLTGNRDVVLRLVDLSLMKSVRELAAVVIKEEQRLDVLVNNAGLAGIPKTMTEEGLENIMAANYFGHFLLTNLLMGLLNRSAPSRIVNVSSLAHKRLSVLDFEDLNAEKSFSKQGRYGLSKLCNILFTRELAARLENTGVTTYSLHPGVISTEIWRNLPLWVTPLFACVKFAFFKSSEEGAQTTIYCAVSEDVASDSGKYYSDCMVAEDQCSELGKDMGVARKLWEVTERLTGLEK